MDEDEMIRFIPYLTILQMSRIYKKQRIDRLIQSVSSGDFADKFLKQYKIIDDDE